MDVSSLNMSHVLTRVMIFDGHVDLEEGNRHTLLEGDIGRLSISKDPMMSHEHHVKVIPFVERKASFLFGTTREHHAFRSRVSSQKYNSDPGLPEVRLSLDWSAHAVMQRHTPLRRWYDFLTNIIAIIGGLFVVARAFDTVLFSFIQRFFYKKSGNRGALNLKGVMS